MNGKKKCLFIPLAAGKLLKEIQMPKLKLEMNVKIKISKFV